MEVNYIFVQKDNKNNSEPFHSKIENMLFSLFSSSELDKLNISDSKQNSYTIYAELSNEDSNMVYLKIICDEKPSKAAEILDKASKIITNGPHRKDYYITKTYDEASHSFCCRTMSHFGVFERRLRELIYLTIIKLFGSKWFDKTFEETLQNELKGKVKNKKIALIENALEELTYEQLKTYLFCDTSLVSSKELLNNELSEENIQNLSKDDIISYINSSRPVSLWNRFFSKYKDLSCVCDDINYLQEYRNKVMHHKTFTFEEFTDVKKRLNRVNKKLEKAIEIMEDVIYSDNDYMNVAENITQALSKLLTDTASSLEIMALIKSLYEFIKPLKELRDKLYPSQMMKTITGPIAITKTLNTVNTPKISTTLPLKTDDK